MRFRGCNSTENNRIGVGGCNTGFEPSIRIPKNPNVHTNTNGIPEIYGTQKNTT